MKMNKEEIYPVPLDLFRLYKEFLPNLSSDSLKLIGEICFAT